MSPPVRLEKAELRQLDSKFDKEIGPENNVKVQFNPESLKVSFANQIQTPTGGGDKSGTPARQFVGAGTTKLSLSLYFDATAPLAQGEPAVDDVRKLTRKVAFFITPKEEGKSFIPPAVRFLWGSFQFDGLVDSMEENLEFFSNEGKPLRANVTLSMSQQRIVFTIRPDASPKGAGGAAPPGTRPLAEAPAGATVQGLAAQAGRGGDWQSIASANGIENPRLLAPGQFVDLNVVSKPFR